MFKLLAASIIVLTGGSGTLFVFGQTGVPTKWLIGTLVTILVAAFAAFGTVLKVAYDTAKRWETALEGHPGVESDDGFIGRSKDRQAELSDQQEEIYNQLLIQGELLSELTFTFADIAENLEENENVDVDVDIDRIQDLNEKKRKHASSGTSIEGGD